jgi:hypothetical protein
MRGFFFSKYDNTQRFQIFLLGWYVGYDELLFHGWCPSEEEGQSYLRRTGGEKKEKKFNI